MRKISVFGLALATCFAATTAFAQEGSGFGHEGQIAIGGDLDLNFTKSSMSFKGESQSAGTSFAIQPAADYFVIDNLSVGGALGFHWQDSGGDDSSSQTRFSIAPRVGYNIAAAENISIWPRLALAYNIDSFSPPSGSSVGSNSLGLRIDVPVAIHLARHFFIGVGPYFSTDLTSSTEGNDAPKLTQFGLATGLYGWF